jgi:hypothetical protein
MVTRSYRRAAMAALVLVSVVLVGTQASAKGLVQPASCDPSRPGVTHGADASNPAEAEVVPCLTYGFIGFGEGNLVVSSSGDVIYGGPYVPEPQGECVVGAYEISSNIARSTNEGGTWDFVDLRPTNSPPPPFPPYEGPPFGEVPDACEDPPGFLPQSRGSGDPRVTRDPLTDRIWLTVIGNSLGRPPFPLPGAFDGLCQTEISYSDDGGATWTNDPDPVGFGCPRFDFPHLVTAPPTVSTPDGDYPNIVYLCKSTPIPTDGLPSALCWKSTDGMMSVDPLPANTAALGLRRATGGLDGTLYGVTGDPPHLSYSADEAATWTESTGVIPVAGRGVAVDNAGNVYSAGILDGKPQVTYSTDMGATWSAPVAVQAPGVGHAHDVSLAVPPTGTPGPVAVAYIGSAEVEDTQFTEFPNGTGFIRNIRADGVHNGYLVTTDDIFAVNPVFQSVQVDSDAEPLLPYGYPVTGNTTTTSRADYIGVYFDEGDALQIAGILEFFDQSVEDGTLTGRGHSGFLRKIRLRVMDIILQLASALIDGEPTPWAYFYRDVCGDNPGVVGQTPALCDCPIPGVCDEPNPHPKWTNWLGAVATVSDEDSQQSDTGACFFLHLALRGTDGEPPRDIVEGPAAPELADKIGGLIERLCE